MASRGQSTSDHSSGAWIGDIKLCAASVKRVSRGFDEAQALPTMYVEFEQEVSKRLKQITVPLVGQQLEITINGRVIASPTLMEPLSEGAVEMLAPPEGAFVGIAAYPEIPC
ncbi:hypothetical protein GCM10023115_21920 [Pontixanthobacter gangjinensis]